MIVRGWWRFFHNAIVHPMMGVLQWEPKWLRQVADWTADKGWPEPHERA